MRDRRRAGRAALAYAVALVSVAPLLWLLLSAFRPADELYDLGWPRELTLSNVAYVLTEVPFLRYLANSAFVSVTVTVIALFLHSMAAYALARLSFRGRGFAFASVVATLLISLPVILVPLFVVVRGLGMVDSYAGLIVPGLFNAFGIFLANWNSFLWPLAVAQEESLRVVQVGIASLQGQYASKQQYVIAAAMLAAVPTVVVFLLGQRWLVASLKTTGLK